MLTSNPYGQVAGVDGRTAMITTVERGISKDLFGVDIAGNVGIAGTLSSASSRTMKKDIIPYRGDPLELIREVRFVRFRYKAESETSREHVGFIAEETPVDLSGERHNSFLINNSISVSMAATQTLDREVRQLQMQVRALEAELRARKLANMRRTSTHAAAE